MNTQFNSNVIWLQLEYKISTLVMVKSMVEILQNFEAFSDYKNFKNAEVKKIDFAF